MQYTHYKILATSIWYKFQTCRCLVNVYVAKIPKNIVYIREALTEESSKHCICNTLQRPA